MEKIVRIQNNNQVTLYKRSGLRKNWLDILNKSSNYEILSRTSMSITINKPSGPMIFQYIKK